MIRALRDRFADPLLRSVRARVSAPPAPRPRKVAGPDEHDPAVRIARLRASCRERAMFIRGVFDPLAQQDSPGRDAAVVGLVYVALYLASVEIQVARLANTGLDFSAARLQDRLAAVFDASTRSLLNLDEESVAEVVDDAISTLRTHADLLRAAYANFQLEFGLVEKDLPVQGDATAAGRLAVLELARSRCRA